MAHVGDSRLYLVRDDRAYQVRHDHTVAAELVRCGDLSPDQAAAHPQRHALPRAVGVQPFVEVDSLVFDLAAGDRLVLCSDGMSAAIPSTSWLTSLSASCTAEELSDELVSAALVEGVQDDVTVVAIELEGSRRGWSRGLAKPPAA